MNKCYAGIGARIIPEDIRVSGYLWDLVERGHVKMTKETMFLRAIPKSNIYDEWKEMKLES